MPLGAILGVAGGLIQASGAKKAANAQTNAANADLSFQKQVYDEGVARVQPYYDSGLAANAAYQFENGLAPRPQGYTGFSETPGQRYLREQGLAGIQASAAAQGGLFSAATMGDLGRANTDYADTFREQYLNRLAGTADTGLQAASMQSTTGANSAAGMSNAFAARGNAQSAGAIGKSNAFTGGLENVLSGFQYQTNLAGGGKTNGNGNAFNVLFGGKGLGGFV